MKTQLTKEQSECLNAIGCKFPNNLAIQNDRGEYYVQIEISDLLNVLPKELKVSGFKVSLMIEFEEDGVNAHYYCLSGIGVYAKELIDALYGLVILLNHNGLLKFNRYENA